MGLTELVHGVNRPSPPEVRARREAFVSELLKDVEVYPYAKETALQACRLDGE